MKILLVEWDGYAYRDLKESLSEIGIEYYTFSYKYAQEKEVLRPGIEKALSEGEFSAAFSFNFKPDIADCCYDKNIPYIAWVYDGGIRYDMYKRSLYYPTNYIFMFDNRDYLRGKKLGIKNLYHLLLAANVERLDRIKLSGMDKKAYRAEVAFVGTLYPSDFQILDSRLSSYESGIINSIIDTQQNTYGAYFIDELLDEKICEFTQLKSEGEFVYSYEQYQEGLQSLLCKEIARKERIKMLWMLSQKYQVALYSPIQDPVLDKVDFRGAVEPYESAYKVYKTSKINLNITYKRISSGIPLRAMDIMGAGGFLLSNYQPELVEYFRPNIECVVYESIEDAMEKVKYFLSHEEEREEIARNARVAMEEYTYKKQLSKILKIVFSGSA